MKKMGRDPPRIAVHRQIFRSLTYHDASGYVWDDDVTQRVGCNGSFAFVFGDTKNVICIGTL